MDANRSVRLRREEAMLEARNTILRQ
jgi:hypothetical protein